MLKKLHPGPRLGWALILMIRHRAKNYDLALRENEKRPNNKAVEEMRELLHDMLTSDVILALTDAWLKQNRKQIPN